MSSKLLPGSQCDKTCTVDCGHCKGNGRALVLCIHDDEIRNCITNAAVVEHRIVRLRTCHECDVALYGQSGSIPVTMSDQQFHATLHHV